MRVPLPPVYNPAMHLPCTSAMHLLCTSYAPPMHLLCTSHATRYSYAPPMHQFDIDKMSSFKKSAFVAKLRIEKMSYRRSVPLRYAEDRQCHLAANDTVASIDGEVVLLTDTATGPYEATDSQ